MITDAVNLQVDNIKIAGQIYLPGKSDRTPYHTVCVCHGIPAGIPVPGDGGYPLLAERICQQGFAIFIFNFRGTGASGGNLDLLGWTRYLEAVIDYLSSSSEVDGSRLSLLGFSGGAAVSVYVASKDSRVSSVAACACPAEFTFHTKADGPPAIINHFRNIGVFRDKNFPHSAEEWLNNFDLVSPVQHIAEIAPRPLLLVHGSQDDTVNVTHAYKLFDRARQPKQLSIVDGAGHRLRQNDRAVAIVVGWLKAQIGH